MNLEERALLVSWQVTNTRNLLEQIQFDGAWSTGSKTTPRGMGFGRYVLNSDRMAFPAMEITKSLQDVVRTHFLHNASQLKQLVRNSATSNVGIRHYHGNNTEDTLVRNSFGGVDLEKELDGSLSFLN